MRKLKISFNAPVTLTFLLICFLATLAGVMTGGRLTEAFFMVYRAPISPLTILRLFTHVFGHSGWEHFLSNAAYLLLLGPLLEEKYGGRTLAEVIFLTALVTGLINFILFPGTGLCGASGVVFAFILLSSFTELRDGDIPLTSILVAVLFIGPQIYDGLFLQDNISNMAHIVGGIVGAVLGYNLNRRR